MNNIKIINSVALIILLSCMSASNKKEAHSFRGLSCTLHSTNSVVAMGAELDLTLDLYFDSTQTDPSIRYLDNNSPLDSCSLEIIEKETGRVYQRFPYRSEMMGPYLDENIIDLHKQSRISIDFVIHLLSDDGTQITPGLYLVSAVYNNYHPSRQQFSSNLQAQGSASIRGFDEFWRGRIASPPIQLTVLAATDSIVELKVNSGIKIERTDGSIRWSWIESPRYIQIVKRPGYFLGQFIDVWAVTNNDSILVQRRMRGLGRKKQTDIFFHKGYIYNLTREKVRELALSKGSSKLKIINEIFETSEPTKHMWRSDLGNYKILWKQQSIERLN